MAKRTTLNTILPLRINSVEKERAEFFADYLDITTSELFRIAVTEKMDKENFKTPIYEQDDKD